LSEEEEMTKKLFHYAYDNENEQKYIMHPINSKLS
jgi:hypothetical protein